MMSQKVFGEAIDAAATSADHDASSLEIEPGATEISGLPHMLVELLVKRGRQLHSLQCPTRAVPGSGAALGSGVG